MHSSSQNMYWNYGSSAYQGTSATVPREGLAAKLTHVYSQFPVAQSGHLPATSSGLQIETQPGFRVGSATVVSSLATASFGQRQSMNPLDLSIKRTSEHTFKVPGSAFSAFKPSSKQGTLCPTYYNSGNSHAREREVFPATLQSVGHGSSLVQLTESERPRSAIPPYNPHLPSFNLTTTDPPPYSDYYNGRRESFIAQQQCLTYGGRYAPISQPPLLAMGQSIQGLQQTYYNHSYGHYHQPLPLSIPFEQGRMRFDTSHSVVNRTYGLGDEDPRTYYSSQIMSSYHPESARAPPQLHQVSAPAPYSFPYQTSTPSCPGSGHPNYQSPEISNWSWQFPNSHQTQQLNCRYQASNLFQTMPGPGTLSATDQNPINTFESPSLHDVTSHESKETLADTVASTSNDVIQSHGKESIRSPEVDWNMNISGNSTAVDTVIESDSDDSEQVDVQHNDDAVPLIENQRSVETVTVSVIGGHSEEETVHAISKSEKVKRKRIKSSIFSRRTRKRSPPASQSAASKKIVHRETGSQIERKKQETMQQTNLISMTTQVTTEGFVVEDKVSGSSKSRSESKTKTSRPAGASSIKSKTSIVSISAAATAWTSRLRARNVENSTTGSPYKTKLRSSDIVPTNSTGNENVIVTKYNRSSERVCKLVGAKLAKNGDEFKASQGGHGSSLNCKKRNKRCKHVSKCGKDFKANVLPEDSGIWISSPVRDCNRPTGTVITDTHSPDQMNNSHDGYSTGANAKCDEATDTRMTKCQIIDIIKSWELKKQEGETILHRAATLGIPEVTFYCLKNGFISSPNCVNSAGYSPLHEACLHGHLQVAKILLSFDAGPEKSANGIRPLHLACKHGHVDIARLLLWAGVDPFVMTDEGQTAWDMAEEHPEVRFVLQQRINALKTQKPVSVDSPSTATV